MTDTDTRRISCRYGPVPGGYVETDGNAVSVDIMPRLFAIPVARVITEMFLQTFSCLAFGT